MADPLAEASANAEPANALAEARAVANPMGVPAPPVAMARALAGCVPWAMAIARESASPPIPEEAALPPSRPPRPPIAVLCAVDEPMELIASE
jgi:hypothetical protein